MKKILFFAAITLALHGMAQTGVQSTVNEINRTGAIYTQKVVVHNNETFILSQNGSYYEFYRTSTNQSVQILAGRTVKDFQMLGNNIYFCGTDRTQGFLAYSTITDLFAGNFVYDGYIQQSQSINKIQVFYGSDSKVRIAGVGTDSNGQSIFVYCNGNNNWAYDIYRSTDAAETFDDIVLKGNYIVTVGRVSSGYTPDAIIRTYDKNNGQRQSQRRLLNAACGWKYIQPLLADTIGGKSIAIVGKATDTNDDDFITSATLVDVTSFTGTTWCFGSDKYMANYGEYKFIKDVKYSPIDKKLLILEDHPYMYSPILLSTVIVLDIAQPATGHADMYHSSVSNKDYKFNSLAETKPYTFVAAGVNATDNRIGIWTGNRAFLNGICNFKEKINVTTDAVFSRTPSQVTGGYINNISWNQNIKLDISPISINLICN
jgi:hypothetical protein